MFEESNDNLCRLCIKSSDTYIDIFDPKGTNGLLVWKIIKELLQLEVCKEDGLPVTICLECMQKITEFKYFKTMCINSRIEFLKAITNRGLVGSSPIFPVPNQNVASYSVPRPSLPVQSKPPEAEVDVKPNLVELNQRLKLAVDKAKQDVANSGGKRKRESDVMSSQGQQAKRKSVAGDDQPHRVYDNKQGQTPKRASEASNAVPGRRLNSPSPLRRPSAEESSTNKDTSPRNAVESDNQRPIKPEITKRKRGRPLKKQSIESRKEDSDNGPSNKEQGAMSQVNSGRINPPPREVTNPIASVKHTENKDNRSSSRGTSESVNRGDYFECPECPSNFTTRKGLLVHIRFRHSGRVGTESDTVATERGTPPRSVGKTSDPKEVEIDSDSSDVTEYISDDDIQSIEPPEVISIEDDSCYVQQPVVNEKAPTEYDCPECQRSFSNNKALSTHRFRKHKKNTRKRKKDGTAGVEDRRAQNSTDRLQSVTVKESIPFSDLKRTDKRDEKLDKSGSSITCKYCSVFFNSKKALICHLRMKHGYRKVDKSCIEDRKAVDTPKADVSSKDVGPTAKRTNSQENAPRNKFDSRGTFHKCRHCSRRFGTLQELTSHKADKHPSKSERKSTRVVGRDMFSYKCKSCFMRFRSMNRLTVHERLRHGKPNPVGVVKRDSRRPQPTTTQPTVESAEIADGPTMPSDNHLCEHPNCGKSFKTLKKLLKHAETDHNAMGDDSKPDGDTGKQSKTGKKGKRKEEEGVDKRNSKNLDSELLKCMDLTGEDYVCDRKGCQRSFRSVADLLVHAEIDHSVTPTAHDKKKSVETIKNAVGLKTKSGSAYKTPVKPSAEPVNSKDACVESSDAKDGDYLCDRKNCGKSFKSVKELLEHATNKHPTPVAEDSKTKGARGDGKTKSAEKGAQSTKKKSSDNNVEDDENPGFLCTIKGCGLTFKTLYRRYKHKRLDHGAGVKKVAEPTQGFILDPYLTYHICTKCDEFFTSSNELSDHVNTAHPVTCATPDKVSSLKGNLQGKMDVDVPNTNEESSCVIKEEASADNVPYENRGKNVTSLSDKFNFESFDLKECHVILNDVILDGEDCMSSDENKEISRRFRTKVMIKTESDQESDVMSEIEPWVEEEVKKRTCTKVKRSPKVVTSRTVESGDDEPLNATSKSKRRRSSVFEETVSSGVGSNKPLSPDFGSDFMESDSASPVMNIKIESIESSDVCFDSEPSIQSTDTRELGVQNESSQRTSEVPKVPGLIAEGSDCIVEDEPNESTDLADKINRSFANKVLAKDSIVSNITSEPELISSYGNQLDRESISNPVVDLNARQNTPVKIGSSENSIGTSKKVDVDKISEGILKSSAENSEATNEQSNANVKPGITSKSVVVQSCPESSSRKIGSCYIVKDTETDVIHTDSVDSRKLKSSTDDGLTVTAVERSRIKEPDADTALSNINGLEKPGRTDDMVDKADKTLLGGDVKESKSVSCPDVEQSVLLKADSPNGKDSVSSVPSTNTVETKSVDQSAGDKVELTLFKDTKESSFNIPLKKTKSPSTSEADLTARTQSSKQESVCKETNLVDQTMDRKVKSAQDKVSSDSSSNIPLKKTKSPSTSEADLTANTQSSKQESVCKETNLVDQTMDRKVKSAQDKVSSESSSNIPLKKTKSPSTSEADLTANTQSSKQESVCKETNLVDQTMDRKVKSAQDKVSKESSTRSPSKKPSSPCTGKNDLTARTKSSKPESISEKTKSVDQATDSEMKSAQDKVSKESKTKGPSKKPSSPCTGKNDLTARTKSSKPESISEKTKSVDQATDGEIKSTQDKVSKESSSKSPSKKPSSPCASKNDLTARTKSSKPESISEKTKSVDQTTDGEMKSAQDKVSKESKTKGPSKKPSSPCASKMDVTTNTQSRKPESVNKETDVADETMDCKVKSAQDKVSKESSTKSPSKKPSSPNPDDSNVPIADDTDSTKPGTVETKVDENIPVDSSINVKPCSKQSKPSKLGGLEYCAAEDVIADELSGPKPKEGKLSSGEGNKDIENVSSTITTKEQTNQTVGDKAKSTSSLGSSNDLEKLETPSKDKDINKTSSGTDSKATEPEVSVRQPEKDPKK